MTSAFHDVRFPTALSFGAVGGPERRTEIVTLANGYEERNSPWSQSRRRYDAGSGLRSLDELDALVAFFEARAGRLYGFRWKDWGDYKSCLPSITPTGGDQVLGQGDEERVNFPLVKEYRSGGQSYLRQITKPVSGTVQVLLSGDPQEEGVDYQIDTTTGVVTFADPPDIGAQVTAGFEFDVPVRFDTDHIAASIATFQAGEIPHIPVIEVRL